MIKQIGIYGIKNTITGKMYIGKSVNLYKRRYEHFYKLKKNIHHSDYLQNSFNKYGKDYFIFGIIEECSIDVIDQREKYWIEYYDTYNNGYNCLLPNGENGGNILSEEEKAKISKSMKRYYTILPKKDRMAKANYMRKFRTDFSNKHKKTYRLYDPISLELKKVFIGSKECANYLNVDNRRLLKSLNKIRTVKGVTYKNYIILKDDEDLNDFIISKSYKIDINAGRGIK
jgi:group I intron endonuclease